MSHTGEGFFLERKEGRRGEKHLYEREISIGCLLHAAYLGSSCNPGMCPDQESNQPFWCMDDAQPNEPPSQSDICNIFLWKIFLKQKKDIKHLFKCLAFNRRRYLEFHVFIRSFVITNLYSLRKHCVLMIEWGENQSS